MSDMWPVTIIKTRYGGGFERGGAWAAFKMLPEEIPTDATGGDLECQAWWSGLDAVSVGTGATPNDALSDLLRRIARDAAHDSCQWCEAKFADGDKAYVVIDDGEHQTICHACWAQENEEREAVVLVETFIIAERR